MRAGIFCNNASSIKSARTELIDLIKENGYEVFVGGIYDGTIHPFFEENNVTFIPLDASRGNTNPIKELKSIFNIAKQVKKYKLDSVLIYGVKNHPSMAIGAKLGKAKNIVCVVNGSGTLFTIQGLKGKLLRFISLPMMMIAYALSSCVSFQNSDDMKMFAKKHIVRSKKKVMVTAGSGVNLEAYPLKPLPKENKFLFLSRITHTKGAFEYIKAAEKVKEIYPSATFDIVGPLDNASQNEKDAAIKNMIEEYSEKGIVAYHGPTSDVASWLEKCRFFVYPSYFEGISRCSMQALSTGRPIITCNTPGCKETVIEGVNGFLVEKQDSDAIAEKMIWLIEHPEETEKMAAESRKFAESSFDVNTVNNQIVGRLIK